MAATDAGRPPKGIRVRDLGPGDIVAGLALTDEVGWNQTIEDWAWMIGHGRGWACLDGHDRVVATALTQPQSETFGWISMVLVTEAWRRRGIASFLMTRSILALGESGHVAGLDATPAGRAVYGALGFRDIYGLTRFRADRVSFEPRKSRPKIRPFVSSDLPRLEALDRTVFGANRLDLLADLVRRAPKFAWLSEAGDGFCLGRDGRGACQLGPVVAEDSETAIGLLAAAFQTLEGPVMIDVPDHHTELVAWLKDAGFRAERPYTRMLLDHDRPLDDPARVFAIAGPELG
jgi:GNAT superfamily N-acetyltransferase